MLELASSALGRARTLGARAFHRFGIHCATHQIRIIIVSCVVITSLFYPALAMYSSSRPRAVSESTSRLDAFLAASSVSGLYAQHDLTNLWGGHEALRIRDDTISRARCRIEQTVRVERILIQSPLTEDVGALNQQNLVSTLHLERRISKLLSSRGTPCLKANGQCFVLSPLSFWDHRENAILSDLHILDTLSLSNNVSIAGIYVTPHMVLAGRGGSEHVASLFDFAQFLALSYFFPEKDCLSTSEHAAWLELLEEATQEDELIAEAQEPTFVALEYIPNSSKSKGFSGISAFLYLAYAAFFAYVTWSMRRMVAVHSRIGLTFTALIEIAVSTITSLSVCALVGFKVTMVPWELLPVVIVFVGAENMFNLVDAVGKTSVTLPVKQRIAEGLSRAGTSNTLKVVSYNSILGVIAFFAEGAIRQFCAFAVVVLVAHWFLAHTFFLAVLSIDIQRLELEELLRQNASLAPSVTADVQQDSPNSRPTNWRKLVAAAQSLLRVRATKNISLFLLLAITVTLYFTTYPPSIHVKENTNVPLPRGALRSGLVKNDFDDQSPAWHIWKLLNPKEDPRLHLRVEVPTILTFRPDAHMEKPVDYKRRFWVRTFLPFFWRVNIVVLPITATTLALYGLLLYLLKDADLLEAQRNRADPDSSDVEDKPTLQGQISFTTLPRAFASDVEHMASSKDGRIVVCIGLQNEVVIWRIDGQTRSHVSIDVADLLLNAASISSTASAISAVAVDDTGDFCAVGTGAGVIGVWSIRNDSVTSLPHLVLDNGCSGVLELEFIALPRHSTLRSGTSSPPTAQTSIIAIYNNNTAAKWSVSKLPTANFLVPLRSSQVVKVTSLRVEGNNGLLVAFCLQDGRLDVIEMVGFEPHLLPNYCIQAGNPSDLVSKVHACAVELSGGRRLIIGAATDAGVISVWDGATAECISILDERHGTLDTLRISSVLSKKCRYCGDLPLESFSIAFSLRHAVLFYKVFVPLEDRRCSCALDQLRQSREKFVGRRSRSNSLVSIGQSSYTRSRLPSLPNSASAIDPPPFPISGHGVHSRRASVRPESLGVLPVTDELEPKYPLGPLDIPTSLGISSNSRNTIWQNVVIVRTGDVIGCERGCWEVAGTRFVGVRRKPRTNGYGNGKEAKLALDRDSTCPNGLTNATLERWEVWLYDPSSSLVHRSPLVALLDASASPLSHRPSHSRHPSDSIPRLPFTRVSPFVNTRSYGLAGFGNTIGLFHYVLP